MRKTTKLLSLVLAALMLVSMFTISAGAKFDDVSVEDSALYDAVELLNTLGVAKGTTETTFGPGENVTRQQMAAFIYRLMKAGRSAEGGTNDSGFTDLDDSTFFHMITWASQTGVIKGRNATTFDPKGGITLQDAYVMLVRALGYEDDTVLPYPFGYIDLAEEIGLDENIPSDVNYTSTLNRGNVAILLANAFYAEMNKTSVEYKFISNKYTDANGDPQITWAYAAVETAATVAKDIFGVVEETFKVKATNNYTMAGYSAVTEDEVEMLVGNRIDADGKTVNTNEEWKLADFGLEGKSDDYFLADITLFVKKDPEGIVKDDVVVAAKSNLVKKIVAASDIVIDRSTKTDAKYYDGGVKSNTADKVMTGLISFGGIDAYLDAVAAPYAYKSLGLYGNNKAAVDFITLNSVTNEEGVAKFVYANTGLNFDGDFDTLSGNNAYETLNDNFATAFGYVYNDGLYEAEVYDADGDGYAEYVFFKQYDFIKMFDKNTKYIGLTSTITEKDKTIVGGVKKEDIVVVGDWNDGDAVLVYAFDNNGSTNIATNYDYIEVKEAITSIETKAKTKKTNANGADVYTFTTGETVDYTDYADKIVGGARNDAFTLGNNTIIWIKGDVLLYTSAVSTSNFDATANYALILPIDATTTPVTTIKVVDRVIDGEFVEQFYVKALVDGTVKTVLLGEAVNAYANPIGFAADSNLNTIKVKEAADAKTLIDTYFLNKFATYTTNDDGSFNFTQTQFNGSMSSNLDATAYVTATNGNIDHVASAVYKLTLDGTQYQVALQDYSKVVIKSKDDDNEDVYTSYDAATLGRIENTNLTGVKMILVNNTKGNIENVGILYAELVGEFGSPTALDYRVIISSYEEKAGSTTKNYVELFNLVDGTTETVLASSALATAGIANNKIVEVREDGKAYAITTPAASFVQNKIFKNAFTTANATYDSGMKLLTFVNDATYMYSITDETTFIYYEDSNGEKELADVSILTNKGNTYNDKFNDYENSQTGAFDIYVIADNDPTDYNSNVKIVKRIIVCPTGKLVA
ncbi:MAG: S-layer homology domain-containing protein [Clostridia bacterium]|nr:S-layer homology domain-containing protein [Clostridia bacterium]